MVGRAHLVDRGAVHRVVHAVRHHGRRVLGSPPGQRRRRGQPGPHWSGPGHPRRCPRRHPGGAGGSRAASAHRVPRRRRQQRLGVAPGLLHHCCARLAVDVGSSGPGGDARVGLGSGAPHGPHLWRCARLRARASLRNDRPAARRGRAGGGDRPSRGAPTPSPSVPLGRAGPQRRRRRPRCRQGRVQLHPRRRVEPHLRGHGHDPHLPHQCSGSGAPAGAGGHGIRRHQLEPPGAHPRSQCPVGPRRHGGPIRTHDRRGEQRPGSAIVGHPAADPVGRPQRCLVAGRCRDLRRLRADPPERLLDHLPRAGAHGRPPARGDRRQTGA
ncbi:MAG: hypothetical protein BWY91_02574 [bacterium ADurb.BinA028]|nr:MAG: hypothetical protein BWY91_02574 [bacterium ADurb.BinA028]